MSEEKNTTPRDTQFAGFGSLLWEEAAKALQFIDFGFDLKQRKSFDAHMSKLFAQRAYDLAVHVFNVAKDDCFDSYKGITMKDVPDMTTRPEETK